MSKSFVARVGSGRMITIPSKFSEHHDIEQDDTIELEVTSHKRDGEVIFEQENESNG